MRVPRSAIAAYLLAVATCLPAAWFIARAAVRHEAESQPFQRGDTVFVTEPMISQWPEAPEAVVTTDDAARIVSTRPHAAPPFAEVEFVTGAARGRTCFVLFSKLERPRSD